MLSSEERPAFRGIPRNVMKIKQFLLSAALAAVVAAPGPAQEVTEDTVVVTVMGKDFTAGEIERIRKSLPTQFQANTQHMNNRSFIETYGYLQALATLAEEVNMLDKEPFKSQFEFNRLNFLAQTYLSQINSTLEITEEDKRSFYEENKGKYAQVRVSMIALDYSPVPELAEKAGKEVVTERDAWEKAESLSLELRQGGNFAELAKEHSSDSATAAKGGDLGIVAPDAAGVSDKLKQAIFKLDEGQISAPIKEGGRFYLFQVTEKTPRPYDQVAADVLRGVQGQKLKARLDEIREEVKVNNDHTDYLQAMPSR